MQSRGRGEFFGYYDEPCCGAIERNLFFHTGAEAVKHAEWEFLHFLDGETSSEK